MTGGQMKTRREKLGLTQARLAELIGVKENTVYRYESGKLAISLTIELAFERVEQKIKEQLAKL